MKPKKTMISLSVIFIIGAITYLTALPAPFVFDDYSYIVDNSFIKDPANLIHLFDSGYFTGIKKRWRPVSASLYFLAYRIWGLNPFGHRTIKILIHLLNGGLVFFLLLKLSRSHLFAFFSALLFLTHPVNAEAVNCIAFNDDILAVFFLLIALLSARDYQRSCKRRDLLISLGSYFCGLLSKETALLFLPLFFLMDYSFPAYSPRGKNVWKLPAAAAVLTVIYALLRFGVFSWPGVAMVSPPGWGRRIVLGVRSLFQYFRFLFFPLDPPCLDYVSPLSFLFFRISLFPLAVLGAAGACLILRMIYSSRRLLFAVGWICLALAPALHILPLPALLADRYLYPGVIGWSYLITLALFSPALIKRRSRRRKKAGIIISVLLVLIFMVLTANKNRIWRDRGELWASTIRVAPGSAIAYNNRGWQFLSRQDEVTAADDFLRAIEIDASSRTTASSLVNLAVIFEKRGENGEAQALAGRALRILPGYPRALRMEGGIYLRRKKYRLAAGKFLEAIRRDRYDYRSHNQLGCLLSEIGSIKEAEKYFRKAVKLNPDAAAPRENLEKLKTANRDQ